MKTIKELLLHIIYRHYAFLSFITNGKKRIVSKKLFYGALLIGISSQVGCRQKNVETKKPENKKDTAKTMSKTVDSTSVIRNTMCYFIPPVIVEDTNIVESMISCYEVSVKTKEDDIISDSVIKEIDELNQKKDNDDNYQVTCYAVVETMPEYPDGVDSLQAFLEREIKYPDSARIKGIKGTVYITFYVDKNGNIINPKVIRGIGGGCDEEALRVVKMLPKWKPGLQNGAEVPIQFNLPVRFILNK